MEFSCSLFSGPTTTLPLGIHFRSSKLFIVSTCALAIFTDCFLYGIVGFNLVPVLALTELCLDYSGSSIRSDKSGGSFSGEWCVFSGLVGRMHLC